MAHRPIQSIRPRAPWIGSPPPVAPLHPVRLRAALVSIAAVPPLLLGGRVVFIKPPTHQARDKRPADIRVSLPPRPIVRGQAILLPVPLLFVPPMDRRPADILVVAPARTVPGVARFIGPPTHEGRDRRPAGVRVVRSDPLPHRGLVRVVSPPTHQARDRRPHESLVVVPPRTVPGLARFIGPPTHQARDRRPHDSLTVTPPRWVAGLVLIVRPPTHQARDRRPADTQVALPPRPVVPGLVVLLPTPRLFVAPSDRRPHPISIVRSDTRHEGLVRIIGPPAKVAAAVVARSRGLALLGVGR